MATRMMRYSSSQEFPGYNMQAACGRPGCILIKARAAFELTGPGKIFITIAAVVTILTIHIDS